MCFRTVDAWVSETFQQHSIETALILLSKATSELLRILTALAEYWFLSIVYVIGEVYILWFPRFTALSVLKITATAYDELHKVAFDLKHLEMK